MGTHPAMVWSRCNACGEGTYPTARSCAACGAWEAATDEPLPSAGSLFTWTVAHVAPRHPTLRAPYAIGYVDLDRGPRVLAPIDTRGEDPEAVLVIGARVALIAHAADDPLPFHAEIAG